MTPLISKTATWPPLCLLLLGLATLSACASVETGDVSPCHGQFRAEGQYFVTRNWPDGSQIVVSSADGPKSGCGV